MKTTLKRLAFFLGLALFVTLRIADSGKAYAAGTVSTADQGRPGTQGAWGVTFSRGYVSPFTTTQNFTTAAPTGATTGLSLKGLNGWHVIVVATSGTLSGVGTLKCAYKDATYGWIGCDTAFDCAVTSTTAGQICRDFQVAVPNPNAQIYFWTSGVTASAGTQVLVTIEGWAQ